MTNQIKFSHMYLKLPNQWQGKKATLLFVREIALTLSQLTPLACGVELE